MLTAQDIPGEKVIGIVVKNQAILAVDKVRYLGDGLALVAARTREIAEAAVKLIKVDYEPLPVVSDPEAALAPDAPRIHGEDNTFVHHKVRKGDVEKGFAQADFIIERKFRTPCIEHSYLEPEAVLAEPAEHGGVVITGSVQNLFSSRRSVAAALKLDLNRVEIIQATLGGLLWRQGRGDDLHVLPRGAAGAGDRQAGEDGQLARGIDAGVLQAPSLRALLQVGREAGRLDHGDGDQLHRGRRRLCLDEPVRDVALGGAGDRALLLRAREDGRLSRSTRTTTTPAPCAGSVRRR